MIGSWAPLEDIRISKCLNGKKGLNDDPRGRKRDTLFEGSHTNTKTPPNLLFPTNTLEGRNFASIKRAENRGVHAHRQSMNAIFWKQDEIHGRVSALRLPHETADMFNGFGELGWRRYVEELRLNCCDDDSACGFVEAS